jgi:hypothetical protein
VDVQTIIAKRKRNDRWRLAALVVAAPALWFWSDGDSSGRFWAAYALYALVEFVGLRWLWRKVERDSRRLDEMARQLGLAPSPVDRWVYEGIRGREYVRVSIEDPLVLQHGGGGVVHGFMVALVLATAAAGGWAWIAVAVTVALASIWYTTRSVVVVTTSREDGTSDRRILHGVTDVPAAIGPEKLTAVEVGPRRLAPPDVDLPGLVSQVWTLDDDRELTSLLRLIGETGLPETLGPLLEALEERKRPMSPRAMTAAEQAVAKIRERHHLPHSGTLAISDDDAGRLAVAREAGTLALPSRDGTKR